MRQHKCLHYKLLKFAMRRFLTIILFFVIGGTALNAQQDAMFTKYMFNSLVYNPAYAGYYDHMYISALYRNQWSGVNEAPVTQTLTLHTPLKNNRVAVSYTHLTLPTTPYV